MTEEYSVRELIHRDPALRTYVTELKEQVELGAAWRAILDGKGSKEQAQLVMTDLALETGYFGVAPPDATGDMLQRQEGRRGVMARILFLADLPSSAITQLRRDALDELQRLEERERSHGN
jgi:hypothetical protein